MLKVYIFSRDNKYLDFLKKQVYNYVLMSDFAMQLVFTGSAKLLDNIDKNSNGIYLIDVDSDEIGLAENIRKIDPRGFIVLLSNNNDAKKMIFKHKIEAMDYILKDDPYIKERISECFDNALEKISIKSSNILQDNFVFKILEENIIMSVEKEKILCFVTSPKIKHTVTLHTLKGSYKFLGSLKKVEAELNDIRFFRCQNNLIVNLDKIISLDTIKYKLTLEGGLLIDIAIKKIKELGKRIKKHNYNILERIKPEIIKFEIQEPPPLTETGDIDITAILEKHGFSIDLSKATTMMIENSKIIKI